VHVNRDAIEAFGRLSELVYTGATFEEIYAAICATAREVIPGCDHACVMTVERGERPRCEAATDDVARLVDELEWETGEGPCLDAVESERYEVDADISTDAVWPKLAERVLEQTPVRGMVGYRIVVEERKAGALNIFSDTAGAFDEDAAGIGALVAAFASVTLTAAAEHGSAVKMRDALASNREIGKAVGMLMVTHGIGSDEAFEMLRGISNRFNVRLAELAEQMVARHERGA